MPVNPDVLEQKAREWVDAKYPDGDFAQYTDSIEELKNDLTTFAREIVEECAKKFCMHCRAGDVPWGQSIYWWHYEGVNAVTCNATPIWEAFGRKDSDART